MNDSDRSVVARVFHDAAARPAAERPAFLDDACADNTVLRAKVEAMLSVLESADDFLAPPAGIVADRTTDPGAAETIDDPTPTRPAPSTEGPGSRIGRYKLLQLIGEGGFGSVYMAEQEHPVKRRVALKIIKPGMDTKQVIARFEAERQALAMMDHPSIAKVLDAGETATGRPYFVMELVKGKPITEYCDENKLDTKARLELFTQVCRAIQHAHQKAVIHRDVKPSNVLVSVQEDGKPVPKVIDFGIAKATQGRLTEKTLFTEFRQFIGTPEYMSPEQADAAAMDVDTRTDVYSLGVLLYGTTPFDARTLRSKAYGEIQRIIREVEPPRPSTRLDELRAEEVRSIALRRQTEPRKLGRLVRRDLDWVVMRCLEKDRTRRYESASGLAADVGRYLAGEPVSAGPPSALYRFAKFARRHRAGLGAAVVIAASLLAGLGAATFGLLRARSERNDAIVAKSHESDLRRTADDLRRAEHQQRVELAAAAGNLYEEQGRAHWLDGDVSRALAYLAEAYRLDPSAPVRRSLLARLLAPQGLAWYLPFRGQIAAVKFAGDNRVVVSTSDGVLAVYDRADGREVLGLPHLNGSNNFGLSADGKWMWSAHWHGVRPLEVHELAGGRRTLSVPGAHGARFSPDGRRVAILSNPYRWQVFPSDGGGPPVELKGRDTDDDLVWQHSIGGAQSTHYWVKLSPETVVRSPSDDSDELLRFSPDGKSIVTLGSCDGRARLWDAESGQLTAALGAPDRCVEAARFDGAGRRVFLLSYPLRPAPSNQPINNPLWSDAARFECWDVSTHAAVWSQAPGPNVARAADLCVTPDGSRVVAVLQIGSPLGPVLRPQGCFVYAWDGRDGSLAYSKEFKTRIIEPRVTVAPDGRSFAVTEAANNPTDPQAQLACTVFESATGSRVAGGAGRCRYSGDGSRFFLASDDSAARVFETGQYAVIATGPSLPRPVASGDSVMLSTDGARLLTADATEYTLWTIAAGTPSAPGAVSAAGRTPVDAEGSFWADDSLRAVVTADRHALGVLRDPSIGRTRPMPISGDGTVAITADGQHLVWSDREGLSLWSLQTGKRITKLDRDPHGFLETGSCVVTPDERMMVGLSYVNTALIWDLRTGAVSTLSPGGVRGAAEINADGSRFIVARLDPSKMTAGRTDDAPVSTAGRGFAVEVCDPATSKCLASSPAERFMPLRDSRPFSMPLAKTIDPAGTRILGLLANSVDKPGPVLGVWDTGTGRLIRSLDLPPQAFPAGRSRGAIASAGFGDEGRYAYLATDRAVFCWAVEGGHFLAAIDGSLLAIDPRLTRILVTEAGMHVVTDGRTGRRIANIDPAHAVPKALSPDGRFAFSDRGDVWDVSTGKLLSRFPAEAFLGSRQAGDDELQVFWSRTDQLEIETLRLNPPPYEAVEAWMRRHAPLQVINGRLSQILREEPQRSLRAAETGGQADK